MSNTNLKGFMHSRVSSRHFILFRTYLTKYVFYFVMNDIFDDDDELGAKCSKLLCEI